MCASPKGRGFLSGGDDRGFEAQGNQCGHGGRERACAGSSRCAAASFRTDVEMTITRNYGETAKEKSNELLWHMLIAVFSVSVLIALTLGLRESLIVFIAIPVTLALTLTVFYLYGYTLNRITLFALIFSIGILVDDAIVVVENIVRHWRMPANQGRPPFEVAIEAVDEVGNPTILATLAVVAAILPMAFVGGLMGPYMRPIPIGASAAMIFSLLVAFVVTPWAAVRILKPSSGGIMAATGRFRDAPLPPGHGRAAAPAGPALEFPRRSCRPAAGFRVAVLLRLRQGEDAAVRQQERVSGDRRYAERHNARTDGARHTVACGRNAEAARSGRTFRPMPERRRPTTSTAWCGITICGGDRMSPDIQVNLLPKEERESAEP